MNLKIKEKNIYSQEKALIKHINDQFTSRSIYVSICELGYCVRTKRSIKKGEIIYRFNGPTISFDETIRRGETECMSLQYDHDRYIDTEIPGKFINHSCEPNAGIINDFDLIALEDLKVHTEIRFDYSTSMDEDHFQMKCECGKPNCRKIVTDFKLLPDETKMNYLKAGIVMSFIRKQYLRDGSEHHLND
ncbi:MAG TPA: SET domain-containing protein-lysine N-methyltransferase [Candidatus Acidoferrales bacterium]|nr:SET domain-containing protein-lysine N-methyltransferase [Candidatus Acidoferrales bacterium]